MRRFYPALSEHTNGNGMINPKAKNAIKFINPKSPNNVPNIERKVTASDRLYSKDL